MAATPIRILHALGSMNPGGVETWLLNILKFVDRDRFKFDICTFGPEPGLYANQVERLGGTMVPCPRTQNPWSFRSRFLRILRQGRYDVVHSHVTLFSGVVLRWASAESVPIRIAHSHTSKDDKANTVGRKYYRSLMKSWIDHYATHGFAASRGAAAELFGGNWQRDARFRVLYYGIDRRPFEDPIVREQVRQEFGIPPGASVVGHVGRFVRAKNHRFLLEIGSEILKLRPNVHFLLVGDGPLRSDIETRAKAMGFDGNMHFLGVRTDIPRLMRGGMDLLIFPSFYEGFGLVLLEAQAAGLNCVVSDAVPEETAVVHHAVKFLPLSVGANRWAGEVVRMLDSSLSPGASGRRLPEGRFTIQESVRNLESVYRSAERCSAEQIVQSHV